MATTTSRQHPDHRWRRHPPGPAHRRRREPRRNGAWYRIVLHHPSRLPGDASLVPLSWRAASCRSGIHRYLRSRHHPAPGTLGYPRARGDRAGPSQPKRPRARTTPWMRSPRPRRRAQDAGSRWPKTVPAAWKPCGCCERRERRQSSAAARPCSNSTTPSLPHRRKCVTRSATSPACSACVPVRPGGRTRSAIETRWSRPSSP